MPSVLAKDIIDTIDKNFRHFIEENKSKKFVIYTNGMGGTLVRNYLKSKFSIIPEYIIDNKVYNGIDILNIEQAKKRNNQNTYFLICSWDYNLYEEIRQTIYNAFPSNQIIDIFPHIRKSLPTESEIIKVFYHVNSYLENTNLHGNFSNVSLICSESYTNNTPNTVPQYTDLRSKIINVSEKFLQISTIEKKAYAIAAYFLISQVNVSDKDIFAGKLERCNVSTMFPSSIKEELEHIKNNKLFSNIVNAEDIGLFTRAPGSHVVLAYDILIQDGIGTQISNIQRYISEAIDISDMQFYNAELIVLRAMQERILKYAQKAQEQYIISKNENLRRIQKACENIAYNRPQTFYEAIQLIIFAHENIIAESGSGSMSFGRLDQYLYPFYKKDLYTNQLTKESAQKLLITLWEKIAQCKMSWQNVTIGGGTSSRDMCNDLTIMCMNASLIVRADQPQISLRTHKNMAENVWDKAFELIRTGMGFPALYNDEIAVKAKSNAGISIEDAWNYSIVGCVELSAGGKEYSHTEGARFNWLKILELMLSGGVCLVTGSKYSLKENISLEDISCFDELYSWYKRELIQFTIQICECIDILSKQYSEYWPVPFLSTMMQGCIESGKDATNCGTYYNNLALNCVGIASTADSLEAIETLVFKDKIITLKELATALNNDFKGYEFIRRKMLLCPKYGNNILSVDKKVQDLTDTFVNTLAKTPMKYRNGIFQAGFYTSYFHATMGELTGASPDGRHAGDALSSSLSPMAGMDKDGPTATINSISRINMEKFSNGMALDLKFSPDFFINTKSYQAIRILIKEYFNKGGLEIQFNVLDKKTLLEAQKDPVKYQNLIVRVSGFSAYFIALEQSLQNEIIKRTEHCFT